MMKHKLLSAFPAVLFPVLLLGQNCIQGVINHYTPVTGFTCNGNIAVVQSAVSFQAGDLVMLIQMQGGECSLQNDSTFGDITNAGNAGNYEINRIAIVHNNNISFQFERTRQYDIAGKVQLVRIPEYTDVSVCNLTCKAWDGSTGGVLAISVSDTLILEGKIDVSSKGFRGGVLVNGTNTSNHETNYFYTPDPIISALKGEGICQIPYAFSSGRGKAANGGGGGNAHNGGGGGGACFGNGGNGGVEFSHTVPDVNTFGVGGINTAFDLTRIFAGGGGGAGHANDGKGSSGGKGGGIALIMAQNIIHNGYKIYANGGNVLGGNDNNDGQGGGGAGGTIAVRAENIANPPLLVEAKGGSGGNSIFQQVPSQKIGPGGGGGGGGLLMYHSTTGVDGDLSAGNHGWANGNDPYGAKDGTNGLIFSNLNLPLDTVNALSLSRDTFSICEGGSVTVDGVEYNQAGFYADTVFATGAGCDTIRQIFVQVKNAVNENISYTLCPGTSITIDGISYSIPGVYKDTLPAISGCDTIRNYIISWSPLPAQTVVYTFCPGQNLTIEGVTYTEPAVLTDTIPGISGCDTVLTSVLSWSPLPLKIREISFCKGDTVKVGNKFYADEGVVTDTIHYPEVCDTILKTTLKWTLLPQKMKEILLCPGDSLLIGQQFYHSGETVVDTLYYPEVCDTIEIIKIGNFVPEPLLSLPDLAVYCPGDPLILESTTPNTVWNNSTTSQNFQVMSSGQIIALATDVNGCTQTDTVNILSCCNEKTIYVPNTFAPEDKAPNNIFRAFSKEPCATYRLWVYDRWGELLFISDTPETGWNGTAKGKNCSTGVYIWVLEVAQPGQKESVVLKGDVTLLR